MRSITNIRENKNHANISCFTVNQFENMSPGHEIVFDINQNSISFQVFDVFLFKLLNHFK